MKILGNIGIVEQIIKFFNIKNLIIYSMDVLKVFNLVICIDRNKNSSYLPVGWIFNIMFAPLGILFPLTKFSLLAYFNIFIFFVLIYSSQSTVMKAFNTGIDGKLSWVNSLFSAFLLYMFQTTIILLFLRYNICTRTLEWEANDYHLTLQQYDNETINVDDGY